VPARRRARPDGGRVNPLGIDEQPVKIKARTVRFWSELLPGHHRTIVEIADVLRRPA
jgi:hypothetical protein